MAAKTNISLPSELVKKLEEKIKGTDFKSVQDYIIYILKQMVSKEENYMASERETYTEEEEAELKKTLKELGYL